MIPLFRLNLKFRYNDIAKYGFAALGESEVTAMEPSGDDALTSQKNTNTNKPAGLGGYCFDHSKMIVLQMRFLSSLWSKFSAGSWLE